MAGIVKLTNNSEVAVEKARNVVLDGGIIIYPTDTLYGIGGNALNANTVERIRKIKRRDGRKPLSIIMTSFDMIREYCEVDKAQELILQTYLPGPFTFIVKMRKPIPAGNSYPVTSSHELSMKFPFHQDGTVGIRMPHYQFTKLLSLKCNVPIISTSANLTGEKPPTEISELDKDVLSSVDLVIDGGKTEHGEGSTVVDLISNKVIRKGAGKIDL